MRHAYLILAHDQFKILSYLIKALDSKDNDIFIHFDKKVTNLPDIEVLNSRVFILEDRTNVFWADVSMIEAEFKLFEKAVSVDIYDYYHLLSGVDMPLKSQDYIHDFFKKNKGKEFIGLSQNITEKQIERRINYYHIFPHDFRSEKCFVSIVKRLLRFVFIQIQKCTGINRNDLVKSWKGSQWVSITHDLILSIISNKDDILKRYANTFGSDEFFIHTYCMNSKFKNHVYCIEDEEEGSLRTIGWENNKIYEWKKEDINTLMSSKSLFARKFSESEIEVVDQLFNEIVKKY